jgi:hypothetical protein
MMGDQPLDFSNRVGQDLHRLLIERAQAELSGASGFDRYTAMLLASLIPVAEVLRDPVAQARDPDAMMDDMMDFIRRRLRNLLEPVLGKTHE